MRVITQLVVVAVMAGVGYGGWVYRDQIPYADKLPWLAGGDKSAKKGRRGGNRPALVEVKPARTGNVVVTVDAVGTAQANEAVVVTAKVTGMVGKIRFREGQWIKKGAVLLELEAGELNAELAEALASRDNAKRLYERAKRLLSTRNVPEARVQDLFGLLQAAEARVAADEARLAETVVRAPFSGRLGLRRISLGALIRPGTEITTLDDTSRVKVDFRVPETALAFVEKGQAVSATSAAYPGEVFEGKVGTVSSRVDPVTRSIEIRAHFDNKQGKLRPGMFLAATLTAAVRENAILIPEESLIASSDARHVFAVKDGKAAKVTVKTGEHVKGEIEILSGLEAGTPVVTGGIQKVRNGQAVKVLPPGGFKKGGKAKPKKPEGNSGAKKPEGMPTAGAKKPADTSG